MTKVSDYLLRSRANARSCGFDRMSVEQTAPINAMNMSDCVSHGSPWVPRNSSAPLPSASAAHHPTIAETNVEFGLAAIAQCGFRSIAHDLGGDSLRNVMLDLWSGNVWVRKPGPASSRSRATG